MKTHGVEHLTAVELIEQFHAARLGEIMVYAVGDLATGIHLARHELAELLRAPKPSEAYELTSVAALAMDYQLRGFAALTQRRLEEGRYQYRITKLKEPTA